MKKEKTVRTYQRRTKTGKIVTVKQHTAKYDAAEALKEAAKKKGAGDELENLKKVKPEKVKVEKPVENVPDYGFTADEYKAWYHWDQEDDPKNKAALKVEKALKKQMGTKAYNKYFDEMSDNYSARGHNKAFKGLSDTLSTGEKKSVTPTKETKTSKGGFDNERSFSQNFPRELRQYVDSKNFSLKKKPTKAVERAFKDAGFEIHYNDVEGVWEPTRNGMRYKETDWSAKNKAERAEKSDVVKWAKANGYSLRKDGTFQLKADAKKSRHEIYTLKDLEAKMGTDKKSVTSSKSSKESQPSKAEKASTKSEDKSQSKTTTELPTIPGLFKKGYSTHNNGWGNVTRQFLRDKIESRVTKAGFKEDETIRWGYNTGDSFEGFITKYSDPKGNIAYVLATGGGPQYDRGGRETGGYSYGNVDIYRGGTEYYDKMFEKMKDKYKK